MRSVTLPPPNDWYADGDLLRRSVDGGAVSVCCWWSMRVTRMLPMCGAAVAVDNVEDDLPTRTDEGRSSDDERRRCTISDDVSACS